MVLSWLSRTATLLAIAAALSFGALAASAADPPGTTDRTASGWSIVKFPEPSPLCTGVGWTGAVYFDRLDCGFGTVAVSGTGADYAGQVFVDVVDGAGNA